MKGQIRQRIMRERRGKEEKGGKMGRVNEESKEGRRRKIKEGGKDNEGK